MPASPLGRELSRPETAGTGPFPATAQVPLRSGAELWLHRISVLTFVFLCATVGVLLVILPWGPKWTENRLLLGYPTIQRFLANSFVRGVCSGLGVLDIWIGFSEAIHYREDRPR